MGATWVPINWRELETALTWSGDEWSNYLDLRTGEVRRSRPGAFREEGDEWSEEEVDLGLAEGVLLPIEPLLPPIERGWMESFTASLRDLHLRGRLEAALRSRRPLRRFQEALVSDRETRERWSAFRGDRIREAAREWLTRRDVEPAP